MTVAEALRFLKQQLSDASGVNSLFEAELILQHLLNFSRSQLYLRRNEPISKELQDAIGKIIVRRNRHEPLPYIIGSTYFHSREFLVNKYALIPRPDTEILVETVLETEKKHERSFLEIGVGSGIISSILLQERPAWRCIGTDISFSALRVARLNSLCKIPLLCADLFSSLKPHGQFDFIVSNPPYISKTEMMELDSSVKDFEPYVALYGGVDGLDFYRTFASQAKNFLKPKGRMYCEIGYLQGSSVQDIFSGTGWKNVKVIHDLGQRWRVVLCSL
jgi:release factor glutamine methyltransferase